MPSQAAVPYRVDEPAEPGAEAEPQRTGIAGFLIGGVTIGAAFVLCASILCRVLYVALLHVR